MSVWTASDEALLAGLATGDTDAAVAFVRRFQRRVFGVALGVLSDAADAEDVAQEAFMRAWRHAGAFDPRRGSVATWLLTITRNAAIDAIRVRRSTPIDPNALLGLDKASRSPSPSDAAEALDGAGRLAVAVSNLPDEQRRALLLARLYGYTAVEVGALEGVPVGTAKTRIRSAMIRLREALAASEDAR